MHPLGYMGAIAAILAAVAALWSPIVKIFKGWLDISEARAKAHKARAEAEAARLGIEAARLKADAAKAEVEATLERLKIQSAEAKQREQVAGLAQSIRDYAEKRRREQGNRNLIFPSSELMAVLGEHASLFNDVMSHLERSGHAAKSWVPEYWQIDAPHLTPKQPGF